MCALMCFTRVSQSAFP
uniref:Uncharacterized protein n=1 Tax=Anguilla anguilla TaxID=7936 RepID=A0A0E9W1I9_ANGAN